MVMRGWRGVNPCEVPTKQKTLLSPLLGETQTAMNSLLEATKMVAVNTDKLLGLSRLFLVTKKKNHLPSSPTTLFITKKLWRLVNWARPI